MRSPSKVQDFVASKNVEIPSPLGFLWLFYLWVTIILVGGAVSIGLYLTLRILGLIWKRGNAIADKIMLFGVAVLLRIQPWLKLNTDLQLPQGPMLIVSNHRSTLDVFILLGRIEGIRILAKSILWSIPFFNIMMWAMRQIPIKRNNVDAYWAAMRKVQDAVKAGEKVHVFPEMTRCPAGFGGIQDFHKAPFWIAYQEKLPVGLIAFQDTDKTWSKGFWRLGFRRPMAAKFLGILSPQDYESVAALQSTAETIIRNAVI